ncbi:MAG: YebC/PmpR family DNA-binding transcriptional regulator [Terriglobus roseus]|nr:YebC/PmpR family DNA-binding transcriptional regulator [Terriglobus roseus]
MLRCRVLCLRTSYHKASPQRCCFSQTPRVVSGHSKWATIKHDKAKNDGAKNKQRSNLAKEIALASKCK